MKKYDFSGWATRNDLLCLDGRTIRRDAFKHNDGQTVPLVWNHKHDNPLNVLGHAELENRDNGVYAYCCFNDTESGRNAKMLVKNGDVSSLSIYANKLKQQGGNVLHGDIKEVSLVLAGANPGAYIDSVLIHSDDAEYDAVIYSGEEIDMGSDNSIKHSDEETVEDVFNTLSEKQKDVAYALIGQALEGNTEEDDEMQHSDEETVEDVFNTLSEKQKNVVYALIGQALEGNMDDEEGDENMKHNIFESDNLNDNDVLSHSEMASIIGDAKMYGSMKESVLQHGIEHIDYLFPDHKNLDTPPSFIQREQSWVSKVMNGTHKTPFSRIKSMHADITADEARAKGYIKGSQKKDEVFTLLKRTTEPTTVYKKQKLHRDDVLDITDFDVVAWLKSEMRMMLDEEIARAILVGDGRLNSSDDKINENNIRPVWKDDDLYTIKAKMPSASTSPSDPVEKGEMARNFITTAIKSRKQYKGSGNPTLFATEDIITECLLVEDKNGRIIYDSIDKLATTLRVKEIVTVPVMENLTRDKGKAKYQLYGIIVNLSDYNVGADKGGAVNMFDDFDIDYNAQKYLIETRCSGALTKPYSAIAIEYNIGVEEDTVVMP